MSEELNEEYSKAEKEVLDYVSKCLDIMKKNLNFNTNETPSITDLQLACIKHEPCLIALTTMYNRQKINLSRAQDDYDAWFAQRYMELKEEKNLPTNKSVWYSPKELEYLVKTKWKAEFAEKRAAIAKADAQRSFIERLVRSWEGYQFTLGTMSKNAQAEAYAAKTSGMNMDEDLTPVTDDMPKASPWS